MTLVLPVFSGRDTAAAVGLPPLAAEGEDVLRSIHSVACQLWAKHAADPLPRLVAEIERSSAFPSAEAVVEALHIGNFLPSSFGAMHGSPLELAALLRRSLALHVVGECIGRLNEGEVPDWLSGAYSRHEVTIMTPSGSAPAREVLLPTPDLDLGWLRITLSVAHRGEVSGIVEGLAGRTSFVWSRGILGASKPAELAAVGISKDWLRIALAAGMLNAT